MNASNASHTFEHALGAKVKIAASDEAGVVIARAQYAIGEDVYLIRYRAADGRAVEAWWGASALYPIS